MTMTLHATRTRLMAYDAMPLEALYPREGFVATSNGFKPIYLGHPNARCDECEAPFSNERKHPRSEQFEGVIEICGGHLMRLTTRKAP